MSETWREGVDRELTHLSEKIDLRFAALEKALELQAEEYERRLGGLNHEVMRINKAASLSVSLEKYESDRAGDVQVVEALRRRVAENQDEVMEYIHTQTGAAVERAKLIGMLTGGLAILVSVLGTVLSFLMR